MNKPTPPGPAPKGHSWLMINPNESLIEAIERTAVEEAAEPGLSKNEAAIKEFKRDAMLLACRACRDTGRIDRHLGAMAHSLAMAAAAAGGPVEEVMKVFRREMDQWTAVVLEYIKDMKDKHGG